MSKRIKLYQVDAFTDKLFKGNPAAVCILDQWIDEDLMQNIAAENNLSETAFVLKKNNRYEIRWFTPEAEVDLCGHATLATAHVLYEHFALDQSTIQFYSHRSGNLFVSQNDDTLSLDFPTDESEMVETPVDLIDAFGLKPIESYRGKTDYALMFPDQDFIEKCEPDFNILKRSNVRGVMITAPGKEVDFVSRFFAPGVGIDEDPVTGSAHTTLTRIWGMKLGKNVLRAKQLSKRGGQLICEYKGDRTIISGKAVTYLVGEIWV